MKNKQMGARLGISIVIALFIGITFSIYGPLEIVLSDPDAFWFQLSDILPTVGVCFFLVFVIAFVLLLLLSYFSDVFYALFCGIGLALYIQGNFTHVSYGAMDGTPIDWQSFGSWPFANTMLWIFIIAGFIILFDAREALCKKVVIFLSLGIIGIQLLTLGTLFVTTDVEEKNNFYVSSKNQLELSDGHNILVIVAEGFDGKVFSEIVAKEIEMVSEFEGFTFYPDTCGTSLKSEEAGIALLTGNLFTVGKSFGDNVKEAYDTTPVYDALKDNGYAINVYAPDSLISADAIDDIDNLCQDELRISSFEQCGKLLYKMVAFHYMPHVLKSNFYYTTTEFSDIAVGSATSPKYSDSNVLLYDKIVNEGITLSDTTNSYQFYWIQGQSEPAVMDRECNALETPVQAYDEGYAVAQYEQAVGVVNLMRELIAELKEKNIYDSTTIIFTADHGWHIQQNPLLVIKPAYASGELEISEAPISLMEDYLPTLMYCITGSNEHGNTIYDISVNDDRERQVYEYVLDADKTYTSMSAQKFPAGAFLYTHVPKLELCKQITLASKDSATMLGTGWYPRETWGRWASESASVQFKLDNAADLVLKVEYHTYAGSGETTVLYNGHEVATLPKSEEKRIETIVIPEKYYNDENLQFITFKTENTSSPEKDGVGADSRLLSLAVTSIKIHQVRYSFGSLIEFSNSGNGSDYFVSGISTPEEGHTWSLGKKGELRIPLAEEPENDMIANIYLRYVFDTSQRIIIRGMNTVLYDDVVTTEKGTISFTVPKECIQDGELVLTFEYPDAVSPVELDISEDSRVLAIGYYAMIFDVVE